MKCKLPKQGGAAGIVWHPRERAHFIVLGSGGGDKFWRSNGKPLDSAQCKFMLMGVDGGAKFQGTNEPMISFENGLSAPGEGFSQLFYDEVTNQIIAIGGAKSKEGMETLKMDTLTIGADNSVKVNERGSKFMIPANEGVSFRWAGSMKLDPGNIEQFVRKLCSIVCECGQIKRLSEN